MNIDKYGQQVYSENDICMLYLSDPQRTIKSIITDKPIKLSDIIDTSTLPSLVTYQSSNLSVKDFDSSLQDNWKIPETYKNFDIAQYVLDLCMSDEELQRAGQELLMFQEREMFPLLIYLKYLVDTMREHNIVWGVGRGSSVSSFVLFLIGIHRINSLYFDLSIDEFLK